jgi:hypothetical protein
MSQAYEEGIVPRSAEAAADLSAKQFYGVKIDSTGKAALCSAAGELCYGVLQNEPTAGKQASIAIGGITFAKAGGVIQPGATVKVHSDGKFRDAAEAITDASGASATAALVGSFACGICRATAATADGDLFPLEFIQLGAIPTTAA